MERQSPDVSEPNEDSQLQQPKKKDTVSEEDTEKDTVSEEDTEKDTVSEEDTEKDTVSEEDTGSNSFWSRICSVITHPFRVVGNLLYLLWRRISELQQPKKKDTVSEEDTEKDTVSEEDTEKKFGYEMDNYFEEICKDDTDNYFEEICKDDTDEDLEKKFGYEMAKKIRNTLNEDLEPVPPIEGDTVSEEDTEELMELQQAIKEDTGIFLKAKKRR